MDLTPFVSFQLTRNLRFNHLLSYYYLSNLSNLVIVALLVPILLCLVVLVSSCLFGNQDAENSFLFLKIEYPVYWSYQEWVEGFRKLLDHFRLDKVNQSYFEIV